MIQVNRIYLIFNSVHFLVDSSDNIDKIIELKENLRNFEAVKKVLFFSGVTIRNPILLDIKSGNITY